MEFCSSHTIFMIPRNSFGSSSRVPEHEADCRRREEYDAGVPLSKRRFGPHRLSTSSLAAMFQRWITLAEPYGRVAVSGWRAFEGSNTETDDVSSIDGFLSAYGDDPPRTYISVRVRKGIELSVDYLRGANTQIAVSFPSNNMIEEVFATLEEPDLLGSVQSGLRNDAGTSRSENTSSRRFNGQGVFAETGPTTKPAAYQSSDPIPRVVRLDVRVDDDRCRSGLG